MRFLFLSLLFSLLVAIFAVQNATPVMVAFLHWSFQTSLVIIILGAATFGAMIILSLALLTQFKLQRRLYAAEQREQQLLGEVESLRRVLTEYQKGSVSGQGKEQVPVPHGAENKAGNRP